LTAMLFKINPVALTTYTFTDVFFSSDLNLNALYFCEMKHASWNK